MIVNIRCKEAWLVFSAWSPFFFLYGFIVFKSYIYQTLTETKEKTFFASLASGQITQVLTYISLFKDRFEDKCHYSFSFFGYILMFQSINVIANFICRCEVTEKGNEWNLPEAAALVTFHEGAVPKPSLFTCSVWSPKLRCPPMGSYELLVSNVIELSHDGPPDLEFNGDDDGTITVSLLHSASDLKGYEVIIKQLVDPYENEWKDLETWHASGAGYMSFIMTV